MRHLSRAVLAALLLASPVLGTAEDLTIISRATVGTDPPVTSPWP